jgi:DNA polymerase
MPTARGSKGKSKLRTSLVVPTGYAVVTADLGQIECRLAAFVCGATNLLQEFRDKKDPYALLATEIFGFPVDRKTHIIEGFIGKTGILGLGYGAGAPKFDSMVTTMARSAGIDLQGRWSLALALDSVHAYRNRYHMIPQGWRTLDRILETAWLGKSGPVRFGPIVISPGKVTGPNGLSLVYNKPRYEDSEYWYNYGRFKHKIYGAKLLENIVQFLARIVIMNAALRLNAKGIRFVLQAHDELVFIERSDTIEQTKQIIHAEMVRPPSWAPNLPLAADVKSGPSYGECV